MDGGGAGFGLKSTRAIAIQGDSKGMVVQEKKGGKCAQGRTDLKIGNQENSGLVHSGNEAIRVKKGNGSKRQFNTSEKPGKT